MLPKTGLRIIRFRGIDVFLHWSWFIIFGVLFWALLEFFRVNVSAPEFVRVLCALLTALLFFSSVLLHELSHSVVANRSGIPIGRITLFVFGGVAQMEKDVPSPRVELKMALAGPGCSFILGILFGGLSYALDRAGAHTLSFALAILAVVNIGMGTFNLIPGFPLDGGRVLRSALWHRSGDLERSTRTASRLGEAMGAALAAGGLILILIDVFSRDRGTALTGAWLFLIGSFLVSAAAGSYRQARIRNAIEHIRVGDVMRPPLAVDGVTTLEEVAETYLRRRPKQPVAILRMGRLAGRLDTEAMGRIPLGVWSATPAEVALAPVDDEESIGPGASLAEAFWILTRRGLHFLWVTEEGRLLGVLSREDLRELVKTRLRSSRLRRAASAPGSYAPRGKGRGIYGNSDLR